MYNTNMPFSDEHIAILKQIIKEPYFKEINDIVSICDLDGDENSILQNMKDYICFYFKVFNESDFIPNTQIFINFFQLYNSVKAPHFILPNNNSDLSITNDLLPISNGYHINKQHSSNKHYGTVNGLYSIGTYLGTDHNLYIAKRSMNSRNLPVSDENRKQVDYNSIMAQCVFEYFDEPVAEYYLSYEPKYPFRVILTKNFLSNNQELIHFSDFYDLSDTEQDTHSNRIKMMERNLELRYKQILGDENFQQLLNKLKLQYCKQHFLKLLIGPMDMNNGNTALIITSNPNSNIPRLDISPAYDLDLSFDVSKDLIKVNHLYQIKGSNGENVTIKSFIQEFKNIPGFKEFLDTFINRVNNSHVIGLSSAECIVNNAFNKTGFKYFSQNQQYLDFLNARFREVLEAYKEIFVEFKGDEEK